MDKIKTNSLIQNKLMKISKNSLNLKWKTQKANLINKQLNNKRIKTNLKRNLKQNNNLNRFNKLLRQFLQSISQKKISMILSLESRTKSKKISNLISMTFITLRLEQILPNCNINLQSKECIYGNFLIP